MSKLVTNSGLILTGQRDILNEAQSFYENLYSFKEVEEPELSQIINKDTIETLNAEENKSLEGEITLEEATFALRNFKNNKSPGTDGFTTEFLKFFWNDIGIFVVNSLNYGYEVGELSSTQKEDIITCHYMYSKRKQRQNIIKKLETNISSEYYV